MTQSKFVRAVKALAVGAALTTAMVSQANTVTVFFGDHQGNIGSYDTVTTVLSALDSASTAGTVGQVIGLAYDPATDSVLALDRGGSNIFSIDAGTGVAGSSIPSNPGIEDLEYFGDDFLVASYTQELFLVDGVTGATSVFLTAAQIDSVGVAGNVSGVTLEAIPVPCAFGMMALGIVAFGMVARKRRAASNA